MTERVQVLVVGAGLGGLTASLFLAREGVEVLTVEREWAQHDDVRVHPQPAMLVKYGIAEDVAEITDFGAVDDALEQPAR